MTAIIFTALTIAFLAALFWLLFAPQKRIARPDLRALESISATPLHCRRFPQICRLLDSEDERFVRQNATPALLEEWRAERRRILRLYLNGLSEDFARLESMARMIASLSPEISRRQEWEWAWLGLQFRLLFRALVIRLALGNYSLPEMSRLTNLVSLKAGELERHMAQLIEYLPSRLETDASV